MNAADARARLAEENPNAMWPDGFDDAFLGLAYRCGQPTLASFSMKKMVGVLVARDNISYEDAMEYLAFNTWDAWVGEGTPIWIDDLDDEEG